MLMHMFLFKNADFFSEKMELMKSVDGERFPVQLWATDLSCNKESASYV